jgi:hypothetical protein
MDVSSVSAVTHVTATNSIPIDDTEKASKRCITCGLVWPAGAFSPSSDTRPGRSPRTHSSCKACNSGSKATAMRQRTARGEVSQQECADHAIEFFARERPEVGERPPKPDDIVKMCSVSASGCGEEMLHSFYWDASLQKYKTQQTCRGCVAAKNRTHKERSIAERRTARDLSIENTARLANEAARGVASCSRGKHEAPLAHFGLRSVGYRNASCRSCTSEGNSSAVRKGKRPAKFLTGDALFADNEKRRLRAEGARAVDADKPIARELGIRRRDKRQTDLSIECAKAGVEPGRDLRAKVPPVVPTSGAEFLEALPITEADHASVVTNLAPTAPPRPKRKSKGAQVREMKAEKYEEYRRQKIEQGRNLNFDAMVPMNAEELFKSTKRASRRAAARCNAPRITHTRRQKLEKQINLSDADRKILIAEALDQGRRFYPRPPGWIGDWLFEATLDCIDPNGNYVLQNLQLVPWIENRARGADATAALEKWMRDRGVIKDAPTIDSITNPDELLRIAKAARDRATQIKKGTEAVLDMFAST